jgi:hypothetical protein
MSTSCTPEQFEEFAATRKAAHTNLLSTLALKERPRKGKMKPQASGGKETLGQFVNQAARPTKSEKNAAARNLVQKVAEFVPTFAWAKGNVCTRTCPPAAAIYASLTQTPFLTEEISEAQFNSVFAAFWAGFEQKKFIAAGRPFDLLFSAVFLLGLLRRPLPSVVPNRLKVIIEHVTGFAAAEFERQIELRQTEFLDLVGVIISPGFNPDAQLLSCQRAFRNLEILDPAATPVHHMVVDQVIANFDAALVEKIIEQPDLISVLFAAQLGPFISNLTFGNGPPPLVRIAEVFAVIMMSQAICDARDDCASMLADICPHLPKQVVLRILKEQAIDDFHPFPNDTSSFEAFLAAELDGTYQLVPDLARRIEETAGQLDVTHWKEAVLPEPAFFELEYLGRVFTPPTT